MVEGLNVLVTVVPNEFVHVPPPDGVPPRELNMSNDGSPSQMLTVLLIPASGADTTFTTTLTQAVLLQLPSALT